VTDFFVKVVSSTYVTILSQEPLMMIPGGDRNMLGYPIVIVIYNIKNNKSAFCWFSIVRLKQGYGVGVGRNF
jgi:hypothetical protein